MQKVLILSLATSVAISAAAPAGAQSPAAASVARAANGERQQRYRISTMERVLEGAVEHGASITRERLQALLPADMLLSENATARGFRLEGYGVFFDVAVPSLEGTLAWMMPTLQQNREVTANALRTLQGFLEAARPNESVQHAFNQLATQVAPMGALPGGPVMTRGVQATAGPVAAGATAPVDQAPSRPMPPVPEVQGEPDRIMDNLPEAYRAEVRDALMDAMLDHSRSLNLAADEWLTVAARSNEARPVVAPMDNQSQTVVIRVRGADLNAYLAGQISREDARKRMDVRVF